jgi:hypothetical protein
VTRFVPEDTHLTYDVDYSLELIEGNRHLVPRNPKTTVCPSRMWVEQFGLFERSRMLGKSEV